MSAAAFPVTHSSAASASASAGTVTPATAPTTTSASTPASPIVDVSDIVDFFIFNYYNLMTREPEKLYLFYSDKSNLTVGIEGEKQTKESRGLKEIHEHLLALGLQQSTISISSLDYQLSLEDSIVVFVLGDMTKPSRNLRATKFAQFFFLAQQEHGYYVLNDCLRFLKSDAQAIHPGTVSPSTLPAVTAETSKPLTTKTMPAKPTVEDANAHAPTIPFVGPNFSRSSTDVPPSTWTKPAVPNSTCSWPSTPSSKSSIAVDTAQPNLSPNLKPELASNAPVALNAGQKSTPMSSTSTLAGTSAQATHPVLSSRTSTVSDVGSLETPFQAIQVTDVVLHTEKGTVVPPTLATVTTKNSSSTDVEKCTVVATGGAKSPTSASMPATHSSSSWARLAASQMEKCGSEKISSMKPVTTVVAAETAATSHPAIPLVKSHPSKTALAASRMEVLKTGSRNRPSAALRDSSSQLGSGSADPEVSVFIKGVTGPLKAEELLPFLEEVGPVTYIDVVADKNCAFANFAEPKDARAARGRKVTVQGMSLVIEERKFRHGFGSNKCPPDRQGQERRRPLHSSDGFEFVSRESARRPTQFRSPRRPPEIAAGSH